MTRITRRTALGTAFAIPLARIARAQAFSRPIRMLVPFAAGGVADLTARAVGQRISERPGRPLVIENRPGAGPHPLGRGLAASEQRGRHAE